MVNSGYGERADWYRNIRARPAVEIETGRDRYAPVQRFLDADEAYQELRGYQRRYPLVSRVLLRWFAGMLRVRYDGTEGTFRTLAERGRMVSFRPARAHSSEA
ncbi:MAG: nitroreductase/quinone reductase family protein [Chloroflexota bacterium]